MKNFRIRFCRYAVCSFAACLALAAVVFAGPPLICHSIEIGGARSLPWITHSWNLSGNENYDLKQLVPDTLAILDSGAPVIVRMETLRRATIYARQDPQVARELLTKLFARTQPTASGPRPDALAYFDAGYLIECYKQWVGKNLPHMTDGMRMDANPAANLDGYSLVKKAIALRGQDREMEFAAALITMDGPQEAHQQHVANATAGAGSDALLAANLKTRFLGNDGLTVAEVFSRDAKSKQ